MNSPADLAEAWAISSWTAADNTGFTSHATGGLAASRIDPGAVSERRAIPTSARGGHNRPTGSCREFSARKPTAADVASSFSTLLAVDGELPYRSAGALYPVHIFVTWKTDARQSDLAYVRHDLGELHDFDGDAEAIRASWFEDWTASAPAHAFLAVDFTRIGSKYGARGLRFALLEAGAVSQLIESGVAAAGMSSCRAGGYDDAELLDALGLPRSQFGIADTLAFGFAPGSDTQASTAP